MAIDTYVPRASDRVLVFAPHPDDDVLGCGGTLALAARAGSAIAIAYVTDGGASHPGSQRVSRAQLTAIREAEALAGLNALGIRAACASFFQARDGEVDAADADLAERLAGLVRRFEPTVALAPFVRDPHPDHRATAALAAAALDAAGSEARRLAYAVWLGVRGSEADRADARAGTDVAVSIGDVLARKRNAIARHRSQFGRVVRDDPNGFRLPHELVAAACADVEHFLAIGRPPVRALAS